MDFLLRCAVLALAAFGLTHLVLSGLTAAWWRRRPAVSPRTEAAHLLLRLRLMPTVVAGVIMAFVAIGLYRFESRDGQELIGAVLWSLAALGAWLVAGTALRVTLALWHTRRLVRTWMADAVPVVVPGGTTPAFRINTGFPVVAVVGVVRPRLMIDGRVLDACEPEQLQAILAHERAHLERGDNLRRLAMAAAPGTWATPDLPRAWSDATEEAADDMAAATSPDTRFHLASALLRVSRLAPAGVPHEWPSQVTAGAFFRGENVERRVRRLVETPGTAGRAPRQWSLAFLVGGLGVALVAQRQIHELMEQVVAFLP